MKHSFIMLCNSFVCKKMKMHHVICADGSKVGSAGVSDFAAML